MVRKRSSKSGSCIGSETETKRMTIELPWRSTTRRIKRLNDCVSTIPPDYVAAPDPDSLVDSMNEFGRRLRSCDTEVARFYRDGQRAFRRQGHRPRRAARPPAE